MDKHCRSEYIKNIYSNYNRRTLAATPKLAAVLLLLIPCGAECSVVLTKRMRTLEHHGGEVSFPGGIMEKGDKALSGTALRETHEEIGIAPDKVQIIGAMDDELSRWGHRVTPYVGITECTSFVPAQNEVDRIYSIPVSHLMNPDIGWTEKWFRGSESRTVYFYRYDNDIVWGLTALIMNRFLNTVRNF